jgi:porin
MKPKRILLAAALLTLLSQSVIPAALAEEREALLGTWGGAKETLADAGVDVEAILTHELVGNTSGGVKRKAVNLGNLDLTASVDTEKAGLWSNGTIFVYGLANYGEEPSKYIGDTQVTSNIETYSTAKIYEAWYEHRFLDERLSVLAGLHDYNSEFDSLEYAGGLTHASFGISPDISQVGPSIFNTTAMAVRIRVQPTDSVYLSNALYDGIPGDPNNPRGTRIRFESGDGLFWGSEVGVTEGESDGAGYYKVALGGWLHTAKFEDFNGESRDRNQGLYLIAERSLLREEDDKQGLGVFFQSGFADASRNQIARYFGGGFAYTGLIDGREQDTVSFGFASAVNSSSFRSANPGLERTETALEANYRANLLPYLAVQPDFQYVINPGTDPELDNAVVVGVRVEVAL